MIERLDLGVLYTRRSEVCEAIERHIPSSGLAKGQSSRIAVGRWGHLPIRAIFFSAFCCPVQSRLGKNQPHAVGLHSKAALFLIPGSFPNSAERASTVAYLPQNLCCPRAGREKLGYAKTIERGLGLGMRNHFGITSTERGARLSTGSS